MVSCLTYGPVGPLSLQLSLQSCSSESFDDREYEDLLSKYSDGGAYSSHGRAMENQQHVQNVKDKITSMKKKFQVRIGV